MIVDRLVVVFPGNVFTVAQPVAIYGTEKETSLIVRTTGAGPLNSAGTAPDPAGNPGTDTAYTVYTYDANGNMTSQSDALAHMTTYVYDHLNRLTSSVDPLGNAAGATPADHATTYQYYTWGGRRLLRDPDGYVTLWLYDHDGRVTESDEIVVGAPYLLVGRNYTYDAAGNVTRKVDRDGRVTKYTYDGLNRQTDEKWFASEGATTPLRDIHYSYDDGGQLLSVTDQNNDGDNLSAEYDYEYYGDGNLMNVFSTLAGIVDETNQPVPVTLSKLFDHGREASIEGSVIGSEFDFFNTFDYDALGRAIEVFQFGVNGFLGITGNDVAQKGIGLEYNNLGQLTTIERFNGEYEEVDLLSKSVYGYDKANRLTGITHQDGDEEDPTTIAGYTWTFDKANRVHTFANSEHTTESLTYTYDADGQLTHYQMSGFAAYAGSYNYDANGNRTSTSTQVITQSSIVHDYTTGLYNRIVTDGLNQYYYDHEGNIIRKVAIVAGNPTGATTKYTWDFRNRLTAVTQYESYADYQADDQVSRVTYAYDAFNNMIGRQEFLEGSTTADKSEHYLYDTSVGGSNQLVLKLADDGR